MTNHPEAALRALESKIRTDSADYVDREVRLTMAHHADELADILRQIEAAPSPPDSSQGEPIAWARMFMGDIAMPVHKTREEAEKEVARLNEKYPEYNRERSIIPLYTTPPPSSPQVAVADGTFSIEQHGDAYALYRGRSQSFHGMNLARISEPDKGVLDLIVNALNAYAAPPSAPKAAEPVEPRAEHWGEAIRGKYWREFDTGDWEWIQQRARSLAQAEQAAKVSE